MIKRLKHLGPGVLVTAAFIGPGTVTTSSLAGANYGFALLWVVLFSVLSTIILQEMSARLGAVTKKGLAQVLRETFATSIWKWPLYILIVIALFVGNSAYEGGNITGAALGVQSIFGNDETFYRVTIGAIYLFAFGVLLLGSYKQFEKLLIGLVAVIALSFLLTLFIVQPNMSDLFTGMFVPSIPAGSLTTVVALIGTTVVPYNLFLHASTVRDHWKEGDTLGKVRADTAISVSVGGLVMIAIVGTAAASAFMNNLTVTSARDLAVQLEPIAGDYAVYLLGIGFLAAGLSSAITAPIATAYVISEISGKEGGITSLFSRGVSLTVLTIGAIIALSGIRPLQIILSAQFANGLLLPVVTCFLLLAMNRKSVLKEHTNGRWANILGGIVFLITVLLGLRAILSATNFL